ncbi:MAG: class I SAM-dependent methyltransferase [Thermoleophilia bacterium]
MGTGTPAASGGGDDPIARNRAMWDERVPIHVGSDFYDVDGFRAGGPALDPRVVEAVGPVEGLDLVHLQCHIGLETIDWARRGASVTGLDFSPAAVGAATSLAAGMGVEARFVAADVRDAPAALGETYDVVCTGIGALFWLPEIGAWADVVMALLRPGARLHVTEFHPVEQVMRDDMVTPLLRYREGEALAWEAEGSYADRSAVTVQNRSVGWVHPVGAVVSALLERGLVIERFAEWEDTHYPRWPFLERDGRYWRFPDGAPSIPLMYSLTGRRPG